jgi:1-deoxy-D-xylulose-5-phosphate synthase
MGGFGSAVLEFMANHGYMARVKRLGIPDAVIEHGEQIDLHHECGFDPQGIADAVRELIYTERVVVTYPTPYSFQIRKNAGI